MAITISITVAIGISIGSAIHIASAISIRICINGIVVSGIKVPPIALPQVKRE